MAKPITHFVLAKNGGMGRFSARGFRVIGVTSTKGRQIYGRELPGDNVTHISEFDVTHKFPEGTTLETALGSIDRAEKEYALHNPGIKEAESLAYQRREAQSLATSAAAKGIRCEHTKTPPEPEICARGDACVCMDPSPRRCNAFKDANAVPPRTGRVDE